jgi:adenylate cyclase
MEFRIGINLGDVMVEGEQIYGDGVNVAARLESLAKPGGICISGKVREEIGNKIALNYDDLGPQPVKNIAEPVRVLRVMLEGRAATRTTTKAAGGPCENTGAEAVHIRQAHRVASEPVMNLLELLEHEHVAERKIVVDLVSSIPLSICGANRSPPDC